MPKILKRIEGECSEIKGKINKSRSAEPNSNKISEENQRKVKKEQSEISADNLIIKSSHLSVGETYNNIENNATIDKYRKGVDLFEHFSGEMRDLAYVIERLVNYMLSTIEKVKLNHLFSGKL